MRSFWTSSWYLRCNHERLVGFDWDKVFCFNFTEQNFFKIRIWMQEESGTYSANFPYKNARFPKFQLKNRVDYKIKTVCRTKKWPTLSCNGPCAWRTILEAYQARRLEDGLEDKDMFRQIRRDPDNCQGLWWVKNALLSNIVRHVLVRKW